MMRSEVGKLPKTPLWTTGLNFLAALGEQKTTRNGVNHLEGRFERSGRVRICRRKTGSSIEREQYSDELTYSALNAVIIM